MPISLQAVNLLPYARNPALTMEQIAKGVSGLRAQQAQISEAHTQAHVTAQQEADKQQAFNQEEAYYKANPWAEKLQYAPQMMQVIGYLKHMGMSQSQINHTLGAGGAHPPTAQTQPYNATTHLIPPLYSSPINWPTAQSIAQNIVQTATPPNIQHMLDMYNRYNNPATPQQVTQPQPQVTPQFQAQTPSYVTDNRFGQVFPVSNNPYSQTMSTASPQTLQGITNSLPSQSQSQLSPEAMAELRALQSGGGMY